MVRDRGQLLLIGAVLIGMTIIGTVVMLNGMQHADAAGSQGENQVLGDAERTEEMVERDTERLVVAVHQSDPGNPADALRKNISAYNNYSQNMSLASGGAVTNVTFNESASRGHRFQQPTGPDFKPTGASNTWEMATDVKHLERFRLSITDFSGVGSSSAFVVVIDIDGGDEWKLRIFEESGPAPRDVQIGTQAPGSGTWTDRCSAEGPPVELNLVTGQAGYPTPGTTCQFPAIGDVASTPYTIRFEDSNKAGGEFDVLADGTDTGDSSSVSTDYPVVPAINYQYRSTDVAYNRTIWVEGGPS